MAVALVGGAGAEGRGLAVRLLEARQAVLIGSRDAERARAAAAEMNRAAGSRLAAGDTNEAVARDGEIVILAIPYAGLAEAADTLRPLMNGKVVVSTIVPLQFGQRGPHAVAVPEGSAAQRLQTLLPKARVVGAFHHLSAETLADVAQPVGTDVLVCGNDAEAKREVMDLAELFPGVRGIDAGPLESARYLEAFTALLLRINRRYKAHAGIRLTHLPESVSVAPR
jgi:NADPH-dependent F420 reductase